MFYTYVLAYPTGEVFYVGKGCGNRVDDHEKEAAKGGISHKCKVIRKIQENGGRVMKYRVYETPNEEDALLYEWVLINLVYGIDNLTNTNTGGDRVHIDNAITIIKKEGPGKGFRGKRDKKWSFIDPTGNKHAFTGKLKSFCDKNNLQPSGMCDLSNGVLKTYKGWIAG